MIELLEPYYAPHEKELQQEFGDRLFTTSELRLLLDHCVGHVAAQHLSDEVIGEAASFIDELYTIADEADALDTPFIKGSGLMFHGARRDAEKVFEVADAISERTGLQVEFARESLAPQINYQFLTKWAGMVAVERGLIHVYDHLRK